MPVPWVPTQLVPFSAQAAIVVSSAGGVGVDFTDIQPAIDAAAPGDTILVKAGSYGRMTIEKPIRILGEGSQVVTAGLFQEGNPGLVIQNLPENSEVLVSGMSVTSNGICPAAFGSSCLSGPSALVKVPILRVQNTLGRVLLHDINLARSLSKIYVNVDLIENPLIDDARLVVFTSSIVERQTLQVQSSELWGIDTEFVGRPGDFPSGSPLGGTVGSGKDGLSLTNSVFYLARSSVMGGYGGSYANTGGPFGGASYVYPGGKGLVATNSTLKLAGGPGSAITGGPGGTPYYGPSSPIIGTNDGGAGLSMLFSYALYQEDLLIQGGGSPGPGAAAPNIVKMLSTANPVPAIYPTLGSSKTSLAPGETTVFDVTGEPFASVVVGASLNSQAPMLFSAVDGASILDLNSLVWYQVLSLDQNGQASATFTMPNNENLIGKVLFVQAFVEGQMNRLTNPMVVSSRSL